MTKPSLSGVVASMLRCLDSAGRWICWQPGTKAVAAGLIAAILLGGCGASDSEPGTPVKPADASAEEVAGPTVCKPQTCATLGAVCGVAPDGCGSTVSCGSCTGGQICGGAGPNRCGTKYCEPRTCEQLGAFCGLTSDLCSQVLDCGRCAVPLTCGGSGVANRCGCTPRTCAELSAACGSVPDGCGGVLQCGDCPSGLSCGGGGPNQCGSGSCAPKTCAQLGATCGFVSDLCAKTLDCGACLNSQVCGGAGVQNQCGCLPVTCAQRKAMCGTIDDACGAQLHCGACPAGSTCGGSGTANQCAGAGGSDGGQGGASGAGGAGGAGGSAGIDASTGGSGGTIAGGAAGADASAGGSGGTIAGGSAGTAGTAQDGSVSCDPPLKLCGGQCVPKTADYGCGGTSCQACALDNAIAYCKADKCAVFACADGYDNCDDKDDNGCEADLQTDISHCGTCDHTCGSPPHVYYMECANGQCKIGGCEGHPWPYYYDCDGDPTSGCEVLATVTNCEGCGKLCYPGFKCELPPFTTPLCRCDSNDDCQALGVSGAICQNWSCLCPMDGGTLDCHFKRCTPTGCEL